LPQKFTDADGRTWTVVLNVALTKKVRQATGVDPYRLADDALKPLGALLADPILLVDVLYLLCGAEGAGVPEESFGGAISGDVIQAAANAFVEALVDFFPDPAKRAALRNVLDKGRKLERLLRDRGVKDLADLDPEKLAAKLLRKVDATRRAAELKEEAELKALLGPDTSKAPPSGSPGSAPASSASTPGPSPSAS
jgi:hypothetical protein